MISRGVGGFLALLYWFSSPFTDIPCACIFFVAATTAFDCLFCFCTAQLYGYYDVWITIHVLMHRVEVDFWKKALEMRVRSPAKSS